MADLKAKKSKVLETLRAQLNKGFIEEEFEVSGFKFRLRTLTEDDEVWADTFLRVSSPAAMLSSRKAPRLAASIVSIDGTPREELFEYPDSMGEIDRKNLDTNPISKRYWLYDQMLYFLTDEANRSFVNSLWEKYEQLEKRRDESLKSVPN